MVIDFLPMYAKALVNICPNIFLKRRQGQRNAMQRNPIDMSPPMRKCPPCVAIRPGTNILEIHKLTGSRNRDINIGQLLRQINLRSFPRNLTSTIVLDIVIKSVTCCDTTWCRDVNNCGIWIFVHLYNAMGERVESQYQHKMINC